MWQLRPKSNPNSHQRKALATQKTCREQFLQLAEPPEYSIIGSSTDSENWWNRNRRDHYRRGRKQDQQPDVAAPQEKITAPSEKSRVDTDLLPNSPCRNAGSIRPIGLASLVDLQVPVCHLPGNVPGSGQALESWLPICRSCKLPFLSPESQKFPLFSVNGHFISTATVFALRLTVMYLVCS